jgi:hypothetical protein
MERMPGTFSDETCEGNIVRAYANIYPPGEDMQTDFHFDDEKYTIFYYPFQWMPKWHGGTEFEVEGSDNQIVDYKYNRAVIFPTTIAHRPLFHTAPTFRSTYAIKTTLQPL